MSVYETYNFSNSTEIESNDLPGTLELYFNEAVEKQLLLKGLVKSDKPDILINVSVDLEEVTLAPVRANNCPRYNDYYSRRHASLAQSVMYDVAEMFGEAPVRGGNPVSGIGGGIYVN